MSIKTFLDNYYKNSHSHEGWLVNTLGNPPRDVPCLVMATQMKSAVTAGQIASVRAIAEVHGYGPAGPGQPNGWQKLPFDGQVIEEGRLSKLRIAPLTDANGGGPDDYGQQEGGNGSGGGDASGGDFRFDMIAGRLAVSFWKHEKGGDVDRASSWTKSSRPVLDAYKDRGGAMLAVCFPSHDSAMVWLHKAENQVVFEVYEDVRLVGVRFGFLYP